MVFSHGIPLHNRHVELDVSAADEILPGGTVAIVVNGTIGDLALEDQAGTSKVYASAAVTRLGGVVYGQWAKVLNTGTTATDLVAWVHDRMS